MKRTADGYTARYVVRWLGHDGRTTAPSLMHWALMVARRMRARGHNVVVLDVRS